MRSLVVIAGLSYARIVSSGTGDSVTKAAVHVDTRFPHAGALVSRTFHPSFALKVPDEHFLQAYRNTAQICFTIDDGKTVACVELDSPITMVEDALPGPTIMTVWVSDGDGTMLSDEPSSVQFDVASDEQMSTMERESPRPPPSDSLVRWYQDQKSSESSPQKYHVESSLLDIDPDAMRAQGDSLRAARNEGSLKPRTSLASACRRVNEKDPFLLVVGVKTAVGNFDRRQAARETWMRTDLREQSGRVCLQFITGQPDPGLPIETAAALSLEASIYGDLLLGGAPGDGGDGNGRPDAGNGDGVDLFGVRDGYENLVEKTTGFMKVAMGHFEPFRYLMMMDDDVYIRLDRLAVALEERPPENDVGGFYAGQVWADELGRSVRPQRPPTPRNALSYDHWPLNVLPRFAIGSHYILSRYGVEFIATNERWLRGVGTLEDVSVGLWMLALQVHPVHLDNFVDAKMGCVDFAMSLASLGPLGIRAAHSNLLTGRHLCHDFDRQEWQR